MKIINVILKENPYLNKNNSLNKAKTEVQKTSEYLQMPYFAYKANFLSNLSFGAIQKIAKPKDFSDTAKFAEYYENKLQRDLGVKDEQDIIDSIDKIVNATGSTKELATEVLTRVTQFGSYSQLDNISESFQKMGYDSIDNNSVSTVDTAQVLNYIAYSKGLFIDKKNPFIDTNTVNLVDEYFIQDVLNEMDSEKINKYSTEKNLAIVDGWNIQIDGKNMSHSMIGTTDNYDDISIAVIEEMQKTGKNLDEVLNGEIIEKIKCIFGENKKVDIIQNESVKNPSVETILNNVNPKVPTKDEIQAIIETVAEMTAVTDTKQLDIEKYNKLKENFAIYLDSYFTAYSPEKLNKVLKDKYNAIQRKVERLGKTMDDVYYFIPTKYKSFSLMTYQYAKVNNIPLNQIVQYNAVYPPTFDLKGKIGVILDDNLCSGDSLLTQEFQYGLSRMHHFYPNNFNLIFSPIFALSDGDIRVKENIERYTRKLLEEKDFVMPSKVLDFDRTMGDHFSKNTYKDELKPYLGALGYDFDNAAIMFPFNIPDNNSDFASLFASFFIDDVFNTNILAKTYTGWNYPMTMQEIHKEVGIRTGKEQEALF